jgi:hypothetical protein
MSSVATRTLETLVSMWEDHWFIERLRSLAMVKGGQEQEPTHNLKGAIAHAHQFRRFLLEKPHGRTALRLDDFLPPYSDRASDGVESFFYLPVPISGWCWSSRRVYRLSAELQAVLLSTALSNLTWADVRLPFDYYMVELATPLMISTGSLCRVVLVSQIARPDGTTTVMLDAYTDLSGYTPLGPIKKQSLQRLLQRGELTRLHQQLMPAWDSLKVLEQCVRYAYAVVPGQHILEAPTNLYPDENAATARSSYIRYKDEPNSETKQMAIQSAVDLTRLAIGLAVYLQMLPVGSTHLQSARRPQRQKSFGRAITDGAELFEVTSSIQLTHDEHVLTGIAGTREERAHLEMSCHFREGYWRRRRGHGHDPSAPKVVHVRPTIVRRDRLPPDGLPLGAAKEL